MMHLDTLFADTNPVPVVSKVTSLELAGYHILRVSIDYIFATCDIYKIEYHKSYENYLTAYVNVKTC